MFATVQLSTVAVSALSPTAPLLALSATRQLRTVPAFAKSPATPPVEVDERLPTIRLLNRLPERTRTTPLACPPPCELSTNAQFVTVPPLIVPAA